MARTFSRSTLLLAALLPSLTLLLALTVLLILCTRLRHQLQQRKQLPLVWASSPALEDAPPTLQPSSEGGERKGRWSAEGARGSLEVDPPRRSSDRGESELSGASQLSVASGSEVERLSGEYVEARLVRFRTASSETMRFSEGGIPPARRSTSPPLQITTASSMARQETLSPERAPRPQVPTPLSSPPRLRTRGSLSPTRGASSPQLRTIYELPPLFIVSPSHSAQPSLGSSRSSLSLGSSRSHATAPRSSLESEGDARTESEETVGPGDYFSSSSYASYFSTSSPSDRPAGWSFNPLDSPTLARSDTHPNSPPASPHLARALPPTPKPNPTQPSLSPSPVPDLVSGPGVATARVSPEGSDRARLFYALPLGEKLPTPPASAHLRERTGPSENSLSRTISRHSLVVSYEGALIGEKEEWDDGRRAGSD